MTEARNLENMSPKLQKVAKRAREDPETKFTSLAHLIDVDALERAFARLRRDAAVGVDGISKGDYEQDLRANLEDLHKRMVAKRYRHQPIKRVHIAKEGGRTRPIGIASTEDKIVQSAIKEVLEAIYEQDFRECSYGFRPGRSAHDALRALNRMAVEVKWILETDVMSFFDSMQHEMLRRMLRIRIADGSLMRLIGKCLRVGVLDGVEYSRPEEGTAQGSTLSPLLGNVFLHYALDRWFEDEVQPRLEHKAQLIRYADDLCIGFQSREEAERVLEWLRQRMAAFGLTLHPEKTRIVHFGRPSSSQRKGPGTFSFLGFQHFWRKSRKGKWVTGCKTHRKSLRRFIKRVAEWCRRHRHLHLADQQRALSRRLQGHFNYFGVNGNLRWLRIVTNRIERAWYKWLRRRSQRSNLNWDSFRKSLLKEYPLPMPRIKVQIWGRTS